VVLLVNPRDDFSTAWDFLEANQVRLPCLLDQSGVYDAYERPDDAFAPFPMQVVVDGAGVIRYASGQNDADALRAVIDGLLAD
jgi:hypothetical protein